MLKLEKLEHKWELHPQKFMLCEELQLLLIADLHLGKAGHFRQAGVAMPGFSHSKDLQHLSQILKSYPLYTIYFLGDLFHHKENNEWQAFSSCIRAHSNDCHLVIGNHDKASAKRYEQMGLGVHQKPVLIKNVLLSHEPLKKIPTEMLNICGHIHPGLVIKTGPRIAKRFPCFVERAQQIIMPAFGQLTGLHCSAEKKDETYHLVLTDKVLTWKNPATAAQ